MWVSFRMAAKMASVMSVPTISAADMLEIQFRKASKKGHVHNATLHPAYSHPKIPADDQPVGKASLSVIL